MPEFSALLLLFLLLLLVLSAALIWQTLRYRRLKGRLNEISEVLNDIENGNLQRQLLADPSEPAAAICFQMNRITSSCRQRLIDYEKRDASYKQVLTSLSHDLRTPLASLTGYLEALENGYASPEQFPAYLSTARSKAEDLKRRLDSLFLWFKLDSGDMTFSFVPADANELTREAAAAMIPSLEQAHMDFQISIGEEEIPVLLDRESYLRIVTNLLQNALQHSGGSQIRLQAGLFEGQYRLIVADNGGGIPEKSLPHIFERLYRADSARTRSGSGLGLSIVKELVLAHGGEVHVESQEGHGSIFTVTLPLPRPLPLPHPLPLPPGGTPG